MRNLYFSEKVKSEQSLYEDLIIESIKMMGQDVYYLPRTLVNVDTIWKDDIPSKFSSAYKIEVYLESVDGYGGEGDLFQKFGVEIRDQVTLVMSRRRWKQAVSSMNNELEGDVPREGDLIYLPLTKSLFEIMLVERESPFYQLGNLPVVKLECELFEYSDEKLDTGIAEIDKIETLGYEVKLRLDPNGADSDLAPINIGDIFVETLRDGTTVSGEVSDWDAGEQLLSLIHVGASDGRLHLFTVTGEIVSQRTGAVRTILGVDEDLNDSGYQNKEFDSDVTWLSFDENNPFGRPE